MYHEPIPQKQTIPPENDRDRAINFIHAETVKKYEEFYKLEIIEAARKLNSTIDNKYKYHKEHVISFFDGPLYEIIFFTLYDRYYSNQFEESKDDRFLELCAVAAAFHDTGFAEEGAAGHVERSMAHAKSAMQHNGYPEHEVEQVVAAIADTQVEVTELGLRVKEKRTNPISAFLMDADTSNFGRVDNKWQTERMAEELGEKVNPKFIQQTERLMSAHNWQTKAAQTLRQEQKEINIGALKQQIVTLQDS